MTKAFGKCYASTIEQYLGERFIFSEELALVNS
jgi:hypothetical protein